MKKNRSKIFISSLFVFFVSLFILTSSSAFAATYGIFTRIAVKVPGTFPSVVQKVKKALENKEWKVVGTFNTSLPSGDNYRETVIVADNASYDKYMVNNGKYPLGAFGLPLRVEVYTSPDLGTAVAMVNPPALARTFSGDSYVGYAIKTSNGLKQAIRKTVGGTASDVQFGPKLNGRFPGGIGGGSFPGSVNQILNYSGSTDSNLRGVANLVIKGIEHNTDGWKQIYEISMPSEGFIEFGVTKNSTESESVDIDSGARAKKSYKYPGIDHGAAFPIEILVYRAGGFTNISILGEMWRMKYYFADAGMWAFMTHMGMPGSIQNSLKQMILYGSAY